MSNANLAMEVSKAGIVDLNRPLSRMDVFYAGSTISLADRMSRRPTERAVTAADLEKHPPTTNKSNLYLSSAGLQTMGEASRGGISPKWTHGIFAVFFELFKLVFNLFF